MHEHDVTHVHDEYYVYAFRVRLLLLLLLLLFLLQQQQLLLLLCL